MNEDQDRTESGRRFFLRHIAIPLLVALIGGGGLFAYFKNKPSIPPGAHLLATNSGRKSTAITVGPFEKPTEIVVQAKNKVRDADPRTGRVTVELFVGEESIGNGYAAGSGRAEAVTEVRRVIPPHEKVTFTAKGSCSHARPYHTELTAYTDP
jgi:hypothetical protein